MLTIRQAETLAAIEASIADAGISPSYDELAVAIGAKSKSQVKRIIDTLVDRGFIQLNGSKGAARAIEVIKPQTRLNPDYDRGYQDGAEALVRERRS